MLADQPVINFLYGEDDFQIAQYVRAIETQLGEPVTAAMSITRLDGTGLDLDALRSVANAMPFMTPRRLVIVERALARVKSKDDKDKWLAYLKTVPASTILILIENKSFEKKEEEQKHWLIQWGRSEPSRVLIKKFQVHKGQGMVAWITQRVQSNNGGITAEAARELADLMGDDTRSTEQEILKLLAYVNYKRTIDIEEVHQVCVSVDETKVYELMDAVMNKDRRRASALLARLLETQDPLYLLGAFVNNIRRYLLVLDLVQMGMHQDEIVKEIQINPYALKNLIPQVRRFSATWLEAVFHRLLQTDEIIKTGQVPGDLALEMLVVDLTTRPA